MMTPRKAISHSPSRAQAAIATSDANVIVAHKPDTLVAVMCLLLSLDANGTAGAVNPTNPPRSNGGTSMRNDA